MMKDIMMPRFALFSLLAVFLMTPLAAVSAQETRSAALPKVPQALQDLEEKGAQMRFLGTKHGLDGWIAIYQGQEQYYYVTPDGKGFLMGILFDDDGRMVTMDQVKDLQKQSGDVLDFLAADQPEASAAPVSNAPEHVADALKKQSPAERMFVDIENSNWIAFGDAKAPAIYTFIDPQCPHCHEFMNDLRKNFIDKDLLQVRIIPVGFQQGSLAQAAFLLAAPDAQARFYRHLDGDESALLAKSDISTQGIQKNMALMQAWKFNVTPLTVYRGRDGEIKLIRGRAKDVAAILADLPPAQP